MKSIVPLINDGLRAWQAAGESLRPNRKPTGKRNPCHFRASEIGECMAKLTYEWRDGRPEPSLTQLARMHTGEVLGQEVAALIRRVKNKYKVTAVDIERYGSIQVKHGGLTFDIDGHADLILRQGKERTVVEVKHVGDAGYRLNEKDGKPYESHEDQLRTYLEIFAAPVGIVLIRRHDGPMLEHVVLRNQDKWERILDRCVEVARHRKAGTIAPREYVADAPPCTFCAFRTACWGTSYGKPDDVPTVRDARYRNLCVLAESFRLSEESHTEARRQYRELAEECAKQAKSDVFDVELNGDRYRIRKVITQSGASYFTSPRQVNGK